MMTEKKIVPSGASYIGQSIFVPSKGVMGEVKQISKDVKNLVLVVKVAHENSYKNVHVEDLIIEAVVIAKNIRLSQAFRLLLQAIKNLFRR